MKKKLKATSTNNDLVFDTEKSEMIHKHKYEFLKGQNQDLKSDFVKLIK